MSDIINFPSKPQAPTHLKTSEQALQYVLDSIKAGDTCADNVIIAWSTDTGDRITCNHLVGGTIDAPFAVGLLEITQQELLK